MQQRVNWEGLSANTALKGERGESVRYTAPCCKWWSQTAGWCRPASWCPPPWMRGGGMKPKHPHPWRRWSHWGLLNLSGRKQTIHFVIEVISFSTLSANIGQLSIIPKPVIDPTTPVRKYHIFHCLRVSLTLTLYTCQFNNIKWQHFARQLWNTNWYCSLTFAFAILGLRLYALCPNITVCGLLPNPDPVFILFSCPVQDSCLGMTVHDSLPNLNRFSFLVFMPGPTLTIPGTLA